MMKRRRAVHRPMHACAVGAGWLILLSLGCLAGEPSGLSTSEDAPRRGRPSDVRGVRCLFDQKPWLNADAAGDRDPEGITYRVFLDSGSGKGVLREGTFYVEMYEIRREDSGEIKRAMVSDWRYPTGHFDTVSAKILGKGYVLRLRWAKKDIAGREVEMITQFIDPAGNATRSATKRLRVPKYAS